MGIQSTNTGVAVQEAPSQTPSKQHWGRWDWIRGLLVQALRTEQLPNVRLGKQDWLWLFGIFLSSRLLIVCIGILGAALFPQDARTLPLVVHPLDNWIRLYDHFDSGWYLSISHGYILPSSGQKDWLKEWAFFPLYPMLLHPLSLGLSALHIPTNTDVLAGVIVSYVTCFGGLVFLYKLVVAELSTAAAKRAVLFQAIFPASLFLSVVYPEGLFLLTCVAAFYAARRRAWAWAGLMTAAALLTRPQGLFLLAPLALEFAGDWWQQRQRGRPWHL